MFTLFAVTRMVIRAGVLAALVATVLSIASAMATTGELQALESHAEQALDWLSDLWARLTDADGPIGDIRLADLASARGWMDLGAGLFGGGEQPAEIDPAILKAVDVARVVEGAPRDGLPSLDGLEAITSSLGGE